MPQNEKEAPAEQEMSFEEARRLSAYCQQKLETLKRKIEILTKDGPEGQTWAPFQPETDAGDGFIPPGRDAARGGDDDDSGDVPF